MLVDIINSESGKRYRVPAAQIIVYTDTGEPCAIAYVKDGLIIHCDAGQNDFNQVCESLKLVPIKIVRKNA